MLVFDIETGPLPEKDVRALSKPFPKPGAPTLDESTIKYGNLGPEKRAEKLQSLRARHAQELAQYEESIVQQEREYWDGILQKAALSATTGKVLAVGYYGRDGVRLDIRDEPDMLKQFWKFYASCTKSGRKMVGHNIYNFDLRFLHRRSWVHEIDVPDGLFQRGRFLDNITFVDTMERWGEPIKLDLLAQLFQVPGKLEGVDGSQFAELLETDRAKAEEYLTRDVLVTQLVAERMGII